MEPKPILNRRDLWLPALVGLVGVLICAVGWGLLVANRRALILESTAETASQTRAAVELRLEQQLDTLRELAELWSRFGLESLAEWKAHVDQRIERMPGLEWVAWVELDDGRQRISGVAGQAPVDLEEARRLGDRARWVGPERDPSDVLGYRVFLPVRTRQDHAGVLVGHILAAPFLHEVLQARAPGYALSVSWEGREIFARSHPSGDPWQRWWRVEEAVALPLGGEWHLVHRPTPELAAMRLTSVPHYLLAAGIVLALVLAVLTHQFRVIVRQSRFLSASNRALEQRGAELESRVAERTEALQDAVEELEAFNYSVSHDLRSPLGAILNFTSMLDESEGERPDPDTETLEMLARIRQSATRATLLLEGLLQLSRAGRAALRFEPIDMTHLARETYTQVRASQDPEAEVELVVDPLPEALADRTLLRDVFANLFSNALKYSRGREKRRIAVSGRIEDGDCIYEVSDNGLGFDMRFSSKLFGLFERLHSDREIEGTGVGLAMIARIVKRHGGRVWGEGSPDRGARFGFAIPRRESA